MKFKGWLINEEEVVTTSGLWKKLEKPNLQQILGWPTPTMPKPPAYWTPEMMEMIPRNVGTSTANKLLQQGMEAHQAAFIGDKLSDFIFYYSPYPPRVKNRVLIQLGDQYPDKDTMELVKIANDHAQQAEPIYKTLKAKDYI